MKQRTARLLIYAGLGLVLLLVFGRASVSFYTDILWFRQLGYSDVFWRRLSAAATLRVVTGLLGAAIVLVNLARVVRHLGPVQLRRRYGNLEIAEQIPHGYVTAGIVVASILAGWWLSGLAFPRGAALAALAWVHRAPWGLTDPLFHRDVGFYVFTLPLLVRLIDFLLLVTVWSAVLSLVGYVLVGAVRLRSGRVEVENAPKLHFALLVASLVLLFAGRYWLSRYGLLLEGTGFGGSIGYTDVHARLPAYSILAVISLIAAAGLVYSAFRRNWLPAIAAVGALLLAGVGLGIAYPSFIQKLRVVPNQLAREEPYIRWNLEFTRRGWNLDEVERTTYDIQPGRAPGMAALATILEHLPLWDPEPLQANLNQRYSGFGYYQFPSVHFGRYGNGDRTQIALAVREFIESGLQADRRTWTTLHTDASLVRGNGVVAVPVAEKTSDGNPVLWQLGTVLADTSASIASSRGRAPPDLTLHRPSVFFGEVRQPYLILNAARDSASDEAVAARSAGIPLGSLLREFAFAWRFGDRNLLFSSELTSDSRLIFRRSVHERVETLAPFMAWDTSPPYPVVAEGRLIWLVDGYSATSMFPIAQAGLVPGIGTVRYIRNSVKAAVDALTGQVSFYIVDPEDPLVAAYARAFPGLLQPLDAMPPELRKHLRYPLLLLQAEADIIEEFHVDQPATFFSGRDEWQIPQEPTAVGEGRDYAPVYMTIQPPGGNAPEFLLVMPFIARERQNMTAILLVKNDANSYGRKTLLQLSRNQQISGPRQVRAAIEQDPATASQLTLWRQGGSNVQIGRLRVVPVDRSVLYVQPIFLAGSGSSIPQLQRIIVSDGNAVVMAETLEEAVAGLLGPEHTPATLADDPPAGDEPWARRALDLLEQADRAVRAGDWATFGRRWTELQDVLRRAAGGRQQ